MTESYFMENTEPAIRNAINIISLFCSIAVVSIMSFLFYFRSYIFNRVTLRFQALIAIIDIARHVMITGISSLDDSTCVFISFFGFFVDHAYVFINVIIALNIQIIYFHQIRPEKSQEIFLIIFSLILALVIDTIPFGFDIYGRNLNGFCFLKSELPKRIHFKIFLIYATILPGLLYCLTIFILTIFFLRMRKSYIKMKIPNKSIVLFGETVDAREFIEKLYIKMSLYLISSFGCIFPYIVDNILNDLNGSSPVWLFALNGFCYNSAGTVNLISLINDPHFQLAIKNIMKNGLFFSRADNKEYRTDIDLKTMSDLKKDDECLIEFRNNENVEFNEFIKFI